jgi:hypothetical protein
MVGEDQVVDDVLLLPGAPEADSQDLILEFPSESEKPSIESSIFTIDAAPPIAPTGPKWVPSPASSVNRWDVWGARTRQLFGRIAAASVVAWEIAIRLLVSAGVRFGSAAARLWRQMRPFFGRIAAASVVAWEIASQLLVSAGVRFGSAAARLWAQRRPLFGRIAAASVVAAKTASRLLVSARASFRAAGLMLRQAPSPPSAVNRWDVSGARMRQLQKRASAAAVVGVEAASRLLASARARFTTVVSTVRLPDRGNHGHVTVAPWLAIARRHAALIAVIAVPLVVRLVGPASQSPGVGLPTLAAVALPQGQWPMAASPVLPGDGQSTRLRQPPSAGQSLDTLKPAPGGQLAASSRPVDPFRDDRSAIQMTLSGYRDAFSTLNVGAVTAVWPTVDVATLQRQFARIDDQNLEYEQCDISIADATATATCTGVIESGFRKGQRRLHSARTQWRFTLEKKAKQWLIRTVSTERSGGTSAAAAG